MIFELEFILLLIGVYLAFPLILRLTSNNKRRMNGTKIISIINSVIITLILYIFRYDFFSYDFDLELYIATGGLFYAINEYFIFKINVNKINLELLFMILSFVFGMIGLFKYGLFCGYLSFVFSFGGLLICRKKEKIKRIIFYFELFLSIGLVCFMLLSFIIYDIALFVYSLLLTILIFSLLYCFIFKEQKFENTANFKKQKKKKNFVDDEMVKKVVIIIAVIFLLGIIIFVNSSNNSDDYIYSCPVGYTLNGKKCYGKKKILADIKYFCTNGTLEGYRCFKESYTMPVDDYVCPDGYDLFGFKCRKNGTSTNYSKCHSFDMTYSFINDKCYEEIEPIKQKGCIIGDLIGDKCISKIYVLAEKEYSCPKGYVLDGIMCEKEDVISATRKEKVLYEENDV